MLLGCSGQCSVFTHISKNGARVTSMDVMPPCVCMPGDGGKLLQGTGLLNIAGEKIGHSGTLGHPRWQRQTGSCNPFFFMLQ